MFRDLWSGVPDDSDYSLELGIIIWLTELGVERSFARKNLWFREINDAIRLIDGRRWG